MWTDDSFCTDDSSLFFEGRGKEVHWLRPSDLCTHPVLKLKDKPSLPVQGALGNCWLICAFSILAKSEKAWKKVFGDEEESLNSKNFHGKVALNLWDIFSGNWLKVEIDDLLPVQYDNDHSKWELMYSQCIDSSQFWVPLLEKACAKFYGCYEALHSGQVSEACLLLTGGYCLTENIPSAIDTRSLQVLLEKVRALLRQSDSFVFASCSTSLTCLTEDRGTVEKVTSGENSIRNMHVYEVLGTESNSTSNDTSIRIWDPWEKCSVSPSVISTQILNKSGLVLTFLSLDLENIVSGVPALVKQSAEWVDKISRGEWKAFSSSGGSRSCVSYFQNPQYLLSALTPMNQNVCILHITLVQHSQRKYNRRKDLEQAIGLHVFSLPSMPKSRLSLQQLKSCTCVAFTNPEYQYSQNVTVLTFLVSKGNHSDKQCYLIVPSAHSPNVNSNFIMRVSCKIPYDMILLQ